MFHNLVNADDALRLVEKLRQGYLRRLLRMFARGEGERVRAAWQHTAHPPKHWGSIPAVRRRWNRLISGREDLEAAAYVVQRYFDGQQALTALSVGCGTGRNEARWAATGVFRRIDAYDLSAERIDEARRHAEAEDLAATLRFDVADVRTLSLPSAAYDVVLAENALHHLTPLREATALLYEALRPGGYLILRDFVGPSRFQWSERQLEAVAGLLAVLPVRYRRRWHSGSVKRRFYRPSRLSMLLSDPSEAAESARILPLLAERFTLIERRDVGGTVLHLLFDDIAHHFLDADEETARWLRLCFDAEDALLASGELPSDFVFVVYRKPAG